MGTLNKLFLFLLLLLNYSCSDSSKDASQEGNQNESIAYSSIEDLKNEDDLYTVILSNENNLSLTTRQLLFNQIKKQNKIVKQDDLDQEVFTTKEKKRDNIFNFSLSFFKKPSKTNKLKPANKTSSNSKVNLSIGRTLTKDRHKFLENTFKKIKVITDKHKNVKVWLNVGNKVSGGLAKGAAVLCATGVGCPAAVLLGLGAWTANIVSKGYMHKKNKDILYQQEQSIRQGLLESYGDLPENIQNKMIRIILENPNEDEATKKLKVLEYINQYAMEEENEQLKKSRLEEEKKKELAQRIALKKANQFLNLAKKHGKKLKSIAKQASKNANTIRDVNNLLTKKGVLIAEESLNQINNKIFGPAFDSLNKFIEDRVSSLNNTLSNLDSNADFMAEYKYARANLSEKIKLLNIRIKNNEKEKKKAEREKESDPKKYSSRKKDIDDLNDKLAKEKEKLEKLENVEKTLGEPIKFFNDIGTFVNSFSEDLGIDPSVSKDINKIVKIGTAAKTVWESAINFSDDPIGSIEAISGLTKLFNNQPSPTEQRHKIVMQGLMRIQKNQVIILKSLKRLEDLLKNNHIERIEELGFIERDINTLLNLQLLTTDTTIKSCHSFFKRNSCEIDSSTGYIREENQELKNIKEDCKFKGIGQGIRGNDLFNGKILQFSSFSKMANHYNQNSLNLKNCVSSVKNILRNSNQYEHLLYGNITDEQSSVKGIAGDVLKACNLKTQSKISNRDEDTNKCLHRYFLNDIYTSTLAYIKEHLKSGLIDTNDLDDFLIRNYNPFDGHIDQLEDFFYKASIQKRNPNWDSFNKFFNKNEKNKIPKPINTKKLMNYVSLGLETLPWVELSDKIFITDISKLKTHQVDFNNHKSILYNSLNWINLTIATENFISGIPILPQLFKNYFYRFKNKNYGDRNKVNENYVISSMSEFCGSKWVVADTHCILRKNPLIRKNFTLYSLSMLLNNSNSLLLYKVGLEEDGDSTLLQQATKFPLPFHFRPYPNYFSKDESPKHIYENAPYGWSLKFGKSFTKLPTAEEIIDPKFHYRGSLYNLISLREKVQNTLSGILIEQSNLSESEGIPLTKEEKTILHEEVFREL